MENLIKEPRKTLALHYSLTSLENDTQSHIEAVINEALETYCPNSELQLRTCHTLDEVEDLISSGSVNLVFYSNLGHELPEEVQASEVKLRHPHMLRLLKLCHSKLIPSFMLCDGKSTIPANLISELTRAGLRAIIDVTSEPHCLGLHGLVAMEILLKEYALEGELSHLTGLMRFAAVYQKSLAHLSSSRLLVEGNVDEFGRTILQHLIDFQEVDSASLWLFNPQSRSLVSFLSFEAGREDDKRVMIPASHETVTLSVDKIGDLLSSLYASRTTSTQISWNDPRYSPLIKPYLTRVGTRSQCLCLITRGSHNIGVLMVGRKSYLNRWTVSDEMYLSSCADLLAFAWDNRQEKLKSEFEVIKNSVLRDLHSCDSVEELLRIPLEWMEQRAGSHAMLAFNCPDKQLVVIPIGINNDTANAIRHAHHGELCSLALKQSNRFIIQDFAQSRLARPLAETQVGESYSALCILPLTTPKKQAFGSIFLLGKAPFVVDDYFNCLCKMVSDFLSMVYAQWAINQERRRSTQLALETAEARSSLISFISHEIRSPLTAIVGYSEYLKNSEVDQELSDAISHIKKNSQRLLRLAEDFLESEKLKAGRLRMNKEICFITSILKNISDLTLPQIKQKGSHLMTSVSIDTPQCIVSDEYRIEQILLNLINNSLKYSNSDTVELNVTFLREEQRVAFEVKDYGVGIPEHEQKLLFNEFHQAENTNNSLGFGLGLAISKQIAELLGGSLRMSSVEGEYTSFVLSIDTGRVESIEVNSRQTDAIQIDTMQVDTVQVEAPQSVETATTMDAVEPHKHSSSSDVDLKGARIIIVDDTEDASDLAKLFLEECNSSVSCLTTSLALEEELERNSCDMVILDLNIGSEDGRDIARFLRQQGYGIPIVVLSAESRDFVWDSCQQAGVSGYIQKPYIPKQFLGEVQKFLVAGEATKDADAIKDVHLSTNSSYPDGHASGTADIASDSFQEQYQVLLNRYMRSLPEKLSQLKLAIASQETDEVIILAHRLAGSAAIYGFPFVSDWAKKIENAAKNGEVDCLPAYYDSLSETHYLANPGQ